MVHIDLCQGKLAHIRSFVCIGSRFNGGVGDVWLDHRAYGIWIKVLFCDAHPCRCVPSFVDVFNTSWTINNEWKDWCLAAIFVVLYLQNQGNCPFKANHEASDTESMLKLGIQTDTLKKSSSACTWLGIKRKLFGREGEGAWALIWLFQRRGSIRKPKNNVRGICQ